jgi:pilus assembly protein Flp/PilA
VFRKLFKNKKGAALVEYGLLIAGVALICAAAVSEFGHKTSDLVGAMAVILPGAHSGDNAPIVSGHLIETALNNTGASGTSSLMGLDWSGIASINGQQRLGANLGYNNLGTPGAGGIIIESK